jgi:hypothetical protein
METLGGEKLYLLLIPKLGTRWGWVVSLTPRPRFNTRLKDPRYPLYRELGGPQSRSEHRGYRKNPLPGIEPRSPGHPVLSQTLNWLSYPLLHLALCTFYNYFCQDLKQSRLETCTAQHIRKSQCHSLLHTLLAVTLWEVCKTGNK